MKKMLAILLAVLFTAGALSPVSAETIPGFPACLSTADMDGSPVDASIFARADVTVLHIWGTDCGPCIAEMPEIAAWISGLPENVQVIGLLTDVWSPDDRTFTLARKILELAGADFVNLLNNDTLAPLTGMIVGTPTTFFLDSSGNLIGEPVLGAYTDKYRETVDELLAR
ncbi:MAG: TlpA disulfide reductase family protein [Clostridia bacterium]|nr:TlpA disulfide reductase family protein [Clostridia bacterium]